MQLFVRNTYLEKNKYDTNFYLKLKSYIKIYLKFWKPAGIVSENALL